jgi:heme iron utilization protein
MIHESRLTQALRELLNTRRVAALGTLDAQDSGQPCVSMVPFALLGDESSLVIHVSALAAHTRNLLTHSQVSLLVTAADADAEPVHALQRVTFNAVAQFPEQGSPVWIAARGAYLARFAEAEPMTRLGDFRFVLLRPTSARQVAGFGAARSVDAVELAQLLKD